MYNKARFHLGIAAMLVLLLLAACSGGGNPVAGNPGGNQQLAASSTAPGETNRILWGYYQCTIDPETFAVEIVPARGMMMHVNAVEWMQPPAGSTSNLGIVVVDGSKWLSEGRFDLDVTLKHPFPLTQFTGFDVMGVFITDGHKTLLSQPGVTYTDGGVQDATMLNPDGFTRWWNQDEFDDSTIRIFSYIPGKLGVGAAGLNAKLNPYKYFADGLGGTADENLYLQNNVSKRGMFAAGTSNKRRYQLKWPMVAGKPQLRFDYAVVASWEPATVVPPVNIPGDFPISANALEPVALSVKDNSDLYYTSTTAGGGIDLDLEVYSWQGLAPGVTIPSTVKRVIVESISPKLALPGGYVAKTPATWSVSPGGANSSVWHIDIPALTPTGSGTANIFVIFETVYDYDNGYGTAYPTGAPLSSYFMHTLNISPYNPTADMPPYCDSPVPEFSSRNVVDIETFTANVGDPNGEAVNIDWSVAPSGNKDWVNVDDNEILVNWWAVTDNGTSPGEYDVCVSVYNGDGWAECCTKVTVSAAPKLDVVTGQNGILLNPQPNQGAQTCDLTVYNTGSGSVGEIMVQGAQVWLYRFNDTYSAWTGITTLSHAGFPEQFNDPLVFADFRRFDVLASGSILHATSGNSTVPSFTSPTAYNINDPKQAFVLHYYNSSGSVPGYLGLFGDIGTNGNPDPDNVPWKHIVDWTGGVIGGTSTQPNTRAYGAYMVNAQWLPSHPSQTHPGTIWMLYSTSPFLDFTNDTEPIGLPGMSTQYTSPPGPVNDTQPALMSLAVDDKNPITVDWDPGTGVQESPLTVWYLLSSEPTAANRKVHLIWLPQNYSIPYFAYDGYIGTGSEFGVDFGGLVPVDIECVYSSKTNSNLDHHYNWLAVLLNTGSGWQVNVYRYDPLFGTVAPVAKYDGSSGTPQALDVDTTQHEIHVLYRDPSNNYRVTVLYFIP